MYSRYLKDNDNEAQIDIWETKQSIHLGFKEKPLLSVGTVIRKTDLQSVHGGENEYEPICYRRSD